MSYKDKEWLYEEYFMQRRTTEDIAEQFGVNRKTVSYFLKKFNIERPGHAGDILVEIACSVCRCAIEKKLRYLRQRIHAGNTVIYCSECLKAYQSETRSGELNANYGGTWHGPAYTDLFTAEERSAKSKASVEKRKENGSFYTTLEKLHEGHKRFFATEEGKKKRIEICSKGYLAACDGRRTSIEIKVAEELANRGVPFTEQSRYELGIADFFVAPNTYIFCDGDYWHAYDAVVNGAEPTDKQRKQIERDERQTKYLLEKGFNVYRFWEHEINDCVESCVDMVLAEINERGA